ncbi:hypothetical protein Tco_0027116 [Tanacetum coccineum]
MDGCFVVTHDFAWYLVVDYLSRLVAFVSTNTSVIPYLLQIPRNSASALERATTFCFIRFATYQGFPPSKVRNTAVDPVRSLYLLPNLHRYTIEFLNADFA